MTSDLDLPLLPSAEQIRRREFATVRRGYDPDQVRDYLTQVAGQVETLEKDLRQRRLSTGAKTVATPPEPPAQKAPMVVPTPPVQTAPSTGEDAYERLTARFAAMIEAADTEATKTVEEAMKEAARILDEARTEADRVRVDAQARAEEARQQGAEALAMAKTESDRVLGSLATRRETLVTQMQDMQSKLLTVAKDLESSLSDREGADAAPTSAALTPPTATGSAATTSSSKRTEFDDDLVDPRYEDLWASTDTPTVDIPDLAAIDVDFDEEGRAKD